MAGLDMKDAADLLSQIHSLICAIAPRHGHLHSEFGMLLKQVFSLRLAFNGHAGTQNLQHLTFVRDELNELSSFKLRGKSKLRSESAERFNDEILTRAQHSLEKLHQELLQENNDFFIFVQPSYMVRKPKLFPLKLGFGTSQSLTSALQKHMLLQYTPFSDLDANFSSPGFEISQSTSSLQEQMLLRTSPFLDLDDTLKHFLSQRSITLRILGIFGQGGIGKTTLLLHILQMLHSQKAFSLIVYVELLDGEDKFFYHDIDDKTIMEVQISVLLQLGGSVEDISDQFSARNALLRRFHELAAADESVCIAFDNITVVDIHRLLHWIPLGDCSLISCVMVTSRKDIDIGHVADQALTLDQKPLPPETARGLLLAYAGVKGRLEHEVKLVDEIYPLCGGIPLALKSVGSLLAEVRDLDFWEGWKSKMKGSKGFPFANEFKLNGILERSYQYLRKSSQEALLDIATFLHGWNWDTLESILGREEMLQLIKFFLIYRTNQEFVSSDTSNVDDGPANVIMHDLMRKLVLEKMGKTCLVLGNQEECSTLLLSNESVLSGVRWLVVNVGTSVEIPLPSDEACLSLDGNRFSRMESLRILDLSGSFKCNELQFPESLRYLRLANNDGLGNQLTKAKIPSNLWHFELQQCKGLLELPLSIYDCKDLGSLKLSECPHLRGFRSYCKWKKLKELHMKGCHGITQLPIDLKYLNLLTLNDCQNLQALPPFSRSFRGVKIQRCPYLSAGLDVASTPISKAAVTPINLKSELQNSADDDQMRSMRGLPVMPVHECGKTWKLSSTSLQLRLQDCDCLELKELGFEDLKNLKKLKLEYCQRLIRLPDSICNLKSLVVLDLHGCSELKVLPWQIENLSALEVLDLSECQKLEELPRRISHIQSLKELNLCGCAELRCLPYKIDNFSSLKILRLANCQSLTRLGESICSLKSLLHLDLHGCSKLKELPEQIGSLGALETLFLMECHSLIRLPNSISDLQSLRVLSINGCSQLKELPEQMQSLRALVVFSAANCGSLQKLCKSICELKSLSVLDLQGCLKLEELPKEFGYNLTSLASLLLMECQGLKSLPEGICRIPMLEELDLSGCLALGRLPEYMGNLRALRKLRLANCESLQRLPHSICHLQSLVNLDLHGCYKLQELPRDFGKLSALETLNLLKCQSLQLLPESVCGLESLKELDMRGSLVEQMFEDRNSYFVGCEKVRSFLSFLRSQFEGA